MNLIEYPDKATLMSGLAQIVARELTETLDAGAAATLAVPGGSTPGPVFDVLCAASLDWGRVTVLPTDERWVPTLDRMGAANAQIAEGKKQGGVGGFLKRVAGSARAGVAFVSLMTIPVRGNKVPDSPRLEPAY